MWRSSAVMTLCAPAFTVSCVLTTVDWACPSCFIAVVACEITVLIIAADYRCRNPLSDLYLPDASNFCIGVATY